MSTALKQIQAEPQRDREVARKLRARRSGLGLLNVRSEQSGKISAKHSKLLVIRCHLLETNQSVVNELIIWYSFYIITL